MKEKVYKMKEQIKTPFDIGYVIIVRFTYNFLNPKQNLENIGDKPFWLVFDYHNYRKGTIVILDNIHQRYFQVMKVYNYNKFYRVLHKLGFKVKTVNCVKIKELKWEFKNKTI